MVRWPLEVDESGLVTFASTLSTFTQLRTLQVVFWTTQALTVLGLICLLLDAFQFQKRLGAVTDTLKACGCVGLHVGLSCRPLIRPAHLRRVAVRDKCFADRRCPNCRGLLFFGPRLISGGGWVVRDELPDRLLRRYDLLLFMAVYLWISWCVSVLLPH